MRATIWEAKQYIALEKLYAAAAYADHISIVSINARVFFVQLLKIRIIGFPTTKNFFIRFK